MRNSSETRPTAADAPVWIADLVFQRHNRSVKYGDDGQLLILSEMSAWADIWPRFVDNSVWIGVFVAGILVNFVLFVCSLKKARHHAGQKKLHCYMGSLAFCNVVIAAGALVCTFLVDLYYDVDSFATLVKLNRDARFARAWQLAKRIVQSEMVEGFALAQSLIVLTICADRYFSLHDAYSSFVRRARVLVCILIVLPYVLALLVLDDDLLRLAFSRNTVNIMRLTALVAGPLLSVAFIGCCLARRLTNCRSRKRATRSSDGGGVSTGGDCGTCAALALIILAQLDEKAGLFLELLKHNFMVELIVGEAHADAALRRFLTVYYEVAHTLFLASPLYVGLLIVTLVPFYRQRLIGALGRAARRACCRRKPPLDYGCETMRSIIAEQNRARQMARASISSPIY